MDLLERILDKKEFKIPAKFENYTLKKYEVSDFDGLMALYNKVFPNYMTKKLWKWKNINNLFGKFFTIIMKYNDEIIAAYNVSPKIFMIFGGNYPCVQSMDTMTKPDFQGLGISTYLAKLTYEYVKNKGYYFVYGFPNKNSWYLFEIKLNWKNFGQIDLIMKDLNQMKWFNKTDKRFLIQEIDKFSNDIDLFCKTCENYFPLSIKKGMHYLNWRFFEHPNTKYRVFLIFESKSNKIVGYFVLKIHEFAEGTFNGHIVDFMIDPRDEKLKREIFICLENFSIQIFKEKCTQISFWMPDEDLRMVSLKKLGYKTIKMETYFGYKIFSKFIHGSKLYSLNNWYITMENSDIF